MILLNREGKGDIAGITQMGGEGAQWIGMAPFTERTHFTQNLGDGTFHHSGSLAVRAAVAGQVNITYKLLYNGFISMTGGQDVAGSLSVQDLTRWLQAEGVVKTIVTTDEPERYKGVTLARNAEVRDRGQLIAAQEDLRAVPGVTVLVHDQGCAAELRRMRKRGTAPKRATRAFINERVCEGCGDCGRKSHCLSVQPIDTEFGRKTAIHQASCNMDYSCLEGDCPSFLTVVPGKKAKAALVTVGVELPLPVQRAFGDEVTLRMMGIGGTGVVTVAQILGMAATLDGKRSLGLDQTGLAQKGGPVVSDVRILAEGDDRSSRAGRGGVDGYIGFDLLGALSMRNLVTASADRTIAVISTTETPTGSSIGDPASLSTDVEGAKATIDAVTRAGGNVYFDAEEIALTLFGDHLLANTIVLGASWQHGLVPLSLEAMREAIRLNGAGVERTLAAFDWGRAVVARPDLVAAAAHPPAAETPALDSVARGLVNSVRAAAGSELERLLEIRVPDLVGYQSARYAKGYVAFVAEVLAADRSAGGSGAAAEAVARQLHRLMAYKDEYEVARLHLDPVQRAAVVAEFGEGAQVHYQLHPPALRALGMDRKISLGPWFDRPFKALRGAKRLRGTALDPFGYAEVRRLERALPDEYRAFVREALPWLAGAYDEVTAAFELPEVIRGYEHVKLANVELYRARVAEARAGLAAPSNGAGRPLVVHQHG
ncbi:MAG: indolepyruvate ferredoxin oxidoreductase [Solirubrobacteraceae bacterium]|nr:indolepyruvate ferredoxin oxidoreductase [Solirubrobacteraceae bacterium]